MSGELPCLDGPGVVSNVDGMSGEYSPGGEQGCNKVWTNDFLGECDVEAKLWVFVE